ncbi:LOW QUALITY PROTEIN: nuclear factor 1 C-type-like [Onychomys torridus]|uniref:LOW QUALITY PROTEIN: nuclear factor 1 C-type-like n=1 Tax=Onychomys torridus TaxID=38674 RepID=UPI00167FC763|nr:LOW QUALITY PROTEIN: nuclear factor 1 C-type-like [Onychomys torridus]
MAAERGEATRRNEWRREVASAQAQGILHLRQQGFGPKPGITNAGSLRAGEWKVWGAGTPNSKQLPDPHPPGGETEAKATQQVPWAGASTGVAPPPARSSALQAGWTPAGQAGEFHVPRPPSSWPRLPGTSATKPSSQQRLRRLPGATRQSHPTDPGLPRRKLPSPSKLLRTWDNRNILPSGVFSVTELIQVSRTPVVTGTGPNFSLGELQGHLAYDLNPASAGMRRTLPSTSSSGSKRHKSGSMEEDVDTSPGGDYYTSPSSPTSSSRNWTEDMEGGISSPVKKTEMDKSPFNSPSPQDSPRLSSFTQHHRPVIAVHSGIARSPHPSSALHFPATSILPQTASTYFPHTAIRYPPHLNPQDPLKDLVSLACDPATQQPGPPALRPARPLQTVPLWD